MVSNGIYNLINLILRTRAQTRGTCALPEVVIPMPSVSDVTELLHSLPWKARTANGVSHEILLNFIVNHIFVFCKFI